MKTYKEYKALVLDIIRICKEHDDECVSSGTKCEHTSVTPFSGTSTYCYWTYIGSILHISSANHWKKKDILKVIKYLAIEDLNK